MINCLDICACSSVDIENLILESKVAEHNYGKEIKSELYHGWTCDVDAKKKTDKLQTYRSLLEDEYFNTSLGGEACLDCDQLQLLYEKTKKLTVSCDIINRPDLVVGKDNWDLWVAQNPYCIAREKWEYLAYDILCDLQIEVSIMDKSEICDLTLDIIREEISCDLVVALDICNKKCDINADVCITEQQCQLEFEKLICNKECEAGLTFCVTQTGNPFSQDTYNELVDLGISPTVINTIFESGSCITIEGEEPILHTTSNSYNIDSIRLTNEINLNTLSRYGVDLTNSKYAQDPNTFIESLNKDYRG